MHFVNIMKYFIAPISRESKNSLDNADIMHSTAQHSTPPGQLATSRCSTRYSFRPFLPVQQGGFALIEVMIAVLVISIGLVGMTRLQTRSLQNNSSAYMRTQASLFSAEIISRMQLQTSAQNGLLPTSVPDCNKSTSGTPAYRLANAVPNLIVTCSISATSRWLTIKVNWADSRWISSSRDTTFNYRMKL